MKILITGPESSGKSTTAQELVGVLDGTLLSEYARTYLQENGLQYTKEDLTTIAKQHHINFNNIIKGNTKKPIVCDTFLLNIKIWSDVKYGSCDPWIINALEQIQFDVILLMKPNIPWVNDPLRESKDSRDLLFQIYQQELEKLNWKYFIIDEKLESRNQQAVDNVNNVQQ